MQSYLEGATKTGLVKVKPIGDGLFVLKYTKKAFFGGLFDDYLEECRGTIIDGDFMPVVLPFRKIYNYGVEERAPKIGADEIVRAYRKINGFMLAVTLLEDELLVSTTGSTTSDFVGYGKELIAYCEARVGPWKALLEPGFTYLFEAVHRIDPHVVPEVEGLYFLGRRETRWGSQIEVPEGVAPTLGCIGLSPMIMSFAALQKEVAICNHEGYVLYVDDRSGRATKIKSPYYLATKLFGRGNLQKLLNGRAKEILDEEFYPLIDKVRADRAQFEELDEQAKMAYCRSVIDEIYGARDE